MPLRPFQNTEEFLRHFDLDAPPPYENVTPFSNCRVGFSITHVFPPGLRFLPAKTQDGRDDTVALIHVYYTHPQESREPVDLRRVPINFNVSTQSLYFRRTRRDFDPSDPRSPTNESVRAARASVAPIPFDSKGEYVFDHDANTFRDASGTALSGREVLDRLFRKFCDTSDLLRGFPIRTKVKFRDNAIKGAGWIISALLLSLRVFFGRTFDEDAHMNAYSKGYKTEDIKPSSEILSFKGFPASLNVVVTWAVLVMALTLARTFLKTPDGALDPILENYLFVACAIIVSLWFFDRVLPLILVFLINAIIRARYWLHFLKVHF